MGLLWGFACRFFGHQEDPALLTTWSRSDDNLITSALTILSVFLARWVPSRTMGGDGRSGVGHSETA